MEELKEIVEKFIKVESGNVGLMVMTGNEQAQQPPPPPSAQANNGPSEDSQIEIPVQQEKVNDELVTTF